MFFLECFLFFDPLFTSVNCIFEAYHLSGDNSIFEKLFFFAVENINCVLISLNKFFYLFSSFLRFFYLLFDILRNLVFILFSHFYQRKYFVQINSIFKALFNSLYPFLHISFFGILQTVNMIINFFFHFLIRNSKRLVTTIRVIMKIIWEYYIKLCFYIIVLHFVQKLNCLCSYPLP